MEIDVAFSVLIRTEVQSFTRRILPSVYWLVSAIESSIVRVLTIR